MRQIVLNQSGVGTSAPAQIDIHGWPEVTLQAVVTGAATYTIEQTLDNVQDPSITPTWFPHPTAAFVGATTNQQGRYPYFPAAIRINQSAGAGSVRLTVLQPGANRA